MDEVEERGNKGIKGPLKGGRGNKSRKDRCRVEVRFGRGSRTWRVLDHVFDIE
jgi:hypothetical protein